MRPRLLIALVLLAIAAAAAWTMRRSPDPLPGFPATVLFTDDRPEDLRFLDPKRAAVAYLSRTVTMGPAGISVMPRLNPLRTPARTALMAVVRLESTVDAPPPPANVTPSILPAAANAAALQVDFDSADRHQFWFYSLLSELRNALPPETPLSVAVRPSWCGPASWVAGLPVAEASPLLFRGSGDPVLPICRLSAGVWQGDPPPQVRRLYWYHPLPWTAAAVNRIVAR